MVRAKKTAALADSNHDDQHFKKLDDLPEERRRAYETILEDFDKQGDINFKKLRNHKLHKV